MFQQRVRLKALFLFQEPYEKYYAQIPVPFIPFMAFLLWGATIK
jgi:hypothetical protein